MIKLIFAKSDAALATFSATMTIKPKHISMTRNKSKDIKFYDALKLVLENRGRAVESLGNLQEPTIKRILEDYGALFLACEPVYLPPVCMFADAESVMRFQAQTQITAADFDGVTIELQTAALEALLAAREEAQNLGLNITPRGGAEAARRSFDDTLRLWDSRLIPALAHWTELERLTSKESAGIKDLPLFEQIGEVLELEKQGIFFSKDFSKSILYSVAAPGCSQHLSLLAFDASEFQNESVRKILARSGWFRTVQNDLPHFTFLGRQEAELPAFGLVKIETAGDEFWIPNI